MKGLDKMDLKDIENKDELLRNIDILMQEYTNMLKSYANTPATYKTAALLYYWLRDYKSLLRNEKRFKPEMSPDLHRGSIINVNLGYNIGSEQGGLHYAIVLHDVPRHSDVATIVPLTSLKPNRDINKLRPFEINLGNELYYQLLGKYQALNTSIPSEINTLENIIDLLPEDKVEDVQKRIDDLINKTNMMASVKTKLNRLKNGSLVLVNQVTTISRARIVDPRNKYDILHGVKVSADSMKLIFAGISKFYGMI